MTEAIAPTSITTLEERVAADIAKFDVNDARIAELREQSEALTINGTDDETGYEAVHKQRMKLVRTRTGIEKIRKEVTADALEYKRRMDEYAKGLVAKLAPIEEGLEAKQKAIDDEKERIRTEAAEAARKRIEGMKAKLFELGFVWNGVAYVAPYGMTIAEADILSVGNGQFLDFTEAAWDAMTKYNKRQEEEAAAKAEQEQKLKAQQEEQERKAEELRIQGEQQAAREQELLRKERHQKMLEVGCRFDEKGGVYTLGRYLVAAEIMMKWDQERFEEELSMMSNEAADIREVERRTEVNRKRMVDIQGLLLPDDTVLWLQENSYVGFDALYTIPDELWTASVTKAGEYKRTRLAAIERAKLIENRVKCLKAVGYGVVVQKIEGDYEWENLVLPLPNEEYARVQVDTLATMDQVQYEKLLAIGESEMDRRKQEEAERLRKEGEERERKRIADEAEENERKRAAAEALKTDQQKAIEYFNAMRAVTQPEITNDQIQLVIRYVHNTISTAVTQINNLK